jgi:hypothetical protein
MSTVPNGRVSDNDCIPRAQVLLHTLQTCSLTVHPRGVFLEDALTARLLKQLKLAVQVLVRRRYAGIPYFHLDLLSKGVVMLQKFSQNVGLLRQIFAHLNALK